MKNAKLWLLSILLLFALALVGCSESSSTDEKDQEEGQTEEGQTEEVTEEDKFGGVVTYALDSEFEGIFNYNFYGNNTDAQIIGFFDEALIKANKNLEYVPGVASWETEDNQHYTFTFEEGVKWHNGEELTVHDWVFSLETLAHPDYDGPRYTNVKYVQGAEEFKAGEADSISGLNVVNDYVLEITFTEPRVNNIENLWAYPLSRKEFEGIPVAEMKESPQVRQNPVGIGPFKVKNIVPGEYVEFERFDDYWQGKPYLDGVVTKVIDSSLTLGALQNEEVHMMEVHPTAANEVKALDNVSVEEVLGVSYYYIGFKLGHYDGETAIMDNEKYQNKDLRKALLYAINRQEWVDAFMDGFGAPVNRPIPSSHWVAADDSQLEQYEYDPEKAKELLEGAGYVDVDGDGFREDPNGDEFVIKFGHYATSNPTFEPRARMFLQYWEEVGIKAEFATGGLIDANLYYEMLENDEPELEVFFGGWGTGADPDPIPLWGKTEFWNLPRWVNEESEDLLQRAVGEEGFDRDTRIALYQEWQELFNEELPVLPIFELYDPYAINNKVKGYDIYPIGVADMHKWYLEK